MNITHDMKNQRFVVEDSGKKGHLDYHHVDDDAIEYYHTFVPEELRHRGIASEIVKFALAYAKKNKLKVIPTCPFVNAYLKKNS